MKIAVISDTHIPATTDSLPEELISKIQGVDMIIHLGDFTELSVLNEFKKIAPVEAVAGNMDSHIVRRELPETRILELEGFKIGLVHGYGGPDGLIKYAKDIFKDSKLDCIIHGHSHIPRIDYVDGVLFFCPGSPTEKIFAPYNAFGILEINDKITPEIIRLS